MFAVKASGYVNIDYYQIMTGYGHCELRVLRPLPKLQATR